MLDPARHDDHLALRELDHPVTELHAERAFENVEELVLVGMAVPDELTREFDELHVLTVELGDDLRAPVLGEGGELLLQVDLVHGDTWNAGARAGSKVRVSRLASRASVVTLRVVSPHIAIPRASVLALALLALGSCSSQAGPAPAPRVTFAGLLAELVDRDRVARLVDPVWEAGHASSTNRESTKRGAPGWFADGDGTGFVRTEHGADGTEWVLLDHAGPGCLTRLWTPFFHAGNLGDHVGPNVRIYLDGDPHPVFDEPWIPLLLGTGSIPRPFATETARAGVSWLPIPFGRSCKITTTGRPFYYTIDYRSYARDVAVETFRKSDLTRHAAALAATAARLEGADRERFGAPDVRAVNLAPQGVWEGALPQGPHALAQIRFALTSDPADSRWLRSTVLELECDGERVVWCPLGDFFCCADSVHPFTTWERSVAADGTLTCRWPMPWRSKATLRLHALGDARIAGKVELSTVPWTWDDRSLHFHAEWHPDEILPGTPIVDWTFVDLRGDGHLVGDALTVLNPTQGWWGEGDDKIYVDAAWELGVPTCFGTGTEDYYGWAGGVVPTRADEFSRPFAANVRVGGVDGNATRGFNVCTRSRALDAIPFRTRLRFDMEASPGTDQRAATDFLGYSAVVFWYARPGCRSERTPDPARAAAPRMGLPDIAARAR